jgi:DNA polymerase I-like protein with 3'-5' exonuclease and polymerase domains
MKIIKGNSIAYIDYSQQEFGIAAALSKDPNMMSSYMSKDPYLDFAIRAKAVPEGATKESHPKERDLYKQCVLAVQFGMGANSLASNIGSGVDEAKYLLSQHKIVFKTYWDWSEQVLCEFELKGKISTIFGWHLHNGIKTGERTIKNFPMQANGAEMLRLAIILCVQDGIKVCAPVHDAILIEAPTKDIEEHVRRASQLMIEASSIVLSGFKLRVDSQVFSYPKTYIDGRGKDMWDFIIKNIDELKKQGVDYGQAH